MFVRWLALAAYYGKRVYARADLLTRDPTSVLGRSSPDPKGI
jgi:hypothetical protein